MNTKLRKLFKTYSKNRLSQLEQFQLNYPVMYVAGPYSHINKKVMKNREILHAKATVNLMECGYRVYSPIAETTALVKYGKLKHTNWEFWRKHDLAKLAVCNAIILLNIPGLIESKGVRGEVKFALKHNIPIYMYYLDCCALPWLMIKKQVFKLFNITKIGDLNE